MTDLIKEIIEGAEAQIEAANFVLTRMRNAPVVAIETGEVILRDGGVWPIPAKCGRVAMFRTADDARAEAAAQNEASAAHGGTLTFKAMSFHKAARLQIARAEAIIERLQNA